MQSQVMVINSISDSLVIFCGDGVIDIYKMSRNEAGNFMSANIFLKIIYICIGMFIYIQGGFVNTSRIQEVDITALCVHPACVISVALTRLRAESFSRMHYHDSYNVTPFCDKRQNSEQS